MDVNILRTFVAVVDQGTLAAAARHLGMSPSMVTSHVQVLERELGQVLFDRTKRPSPLTEAGVLAANRCRVLLTAFDDLKSGVARADGLTGRLRLGAIGSVLGGPLPTC